MSLSLDHRRARAVLWGSLLLCAVAATGGARAAGAQAASSFSARPAGSSGGALAPGSATSSKQKSAKPALHGDPKRALVAFQAMQKAYYIKGTGLYRGEPYSYLWPFSQALAATVSMAAIPHLGVSLTREL